MRSSSTTLVGRGVPGVAGDSSGDQCGDGGAGAVEVVGSPAPEPRSVFFLLGFQEYDTFLYLFRIFRRIKLSKQADATSSNICSRWVQQSAMISEWDMI